MTAPEEPAKPLFANNDQAPQPKSAPEPIKLTKEELEDVRQGHSDEKGSLPPLTLGQLNDAQAIIESGGLSPTASQEYVQRHADETAAARRLLEDRAIDDITVSQKPAGSSELDDVEPQPPTTTTAPPPPTTTPTLPPPPVHPPSTTPPTPAG